MENDVSRVSEHVVQPGYTLWTVGYILRLDAAKELLSTRAEQHMWLSLDAMRCQSPIAILSRTVSEPTCCRSGYLWTTSSLFRWVAVWMGNTMNARWSGANKFLQSCAG